MKRKLLKFWFRYCLFLVKLWYTLTMIVTHKRGVKIKDDFNSYQDIAHELSFGMRYKKDPLNGLLDVLTHPTRIQDRINKDGLIDDCDGHAIYWVTTLMKTGFVKNAWFSFIMFGDNFGSVQGHAVCVFEDLHGKLFWVDYNKPSKYSNSINENQWGWCEQVCEAFSVKGDTLKPIAAGMFKIEKLNKNSRPIFGKTTKNIW